MESSAEVSAKVRKRHCFFPLCCFRVSLYQTVNKRVLRSAGRVLCLVPDKTMIDFVK